MILKVVRSKETALRVCLEDPDMPLATNHLELALSPISMGYNSLIGDMGNSLSGGQKQPLFLARALYRQPKVLFMDEATSHLDVQLEHQVNQAISQLKITRIIIAHRPQTIVKAQRILRLYHGQLQDVTESFKSKYQQQEFRSEAIV